MGWCISVRNPVLTSLTDGKRNGPHGNAGYPLVVLIGAKLTLTDRRGTGTGSEDFQSLFFIKNLQAGQSHQSETRGKSFQFCNICNICCKNLQHLQQMLQNSNQSFLVWFGHSAPSRGPTGHAAEARTIQSRSLGQPQPPTRPRETQGVRELQHLQHLQ